MYSTIDIMLEGSGETVRFKLERMEVQTKQTKSGIAVHAMLLENGDFRVRSASTWPTYKSTDFPKVQVEEFAHSNKFLLKLDNH